MIIEHWNDDNDGAQPKYFGKKTYSIAVSCQKSYIYWSRIETRFPRLTVQRQSASAIAQTCVKLAVTYSNVINIGIRQKWR